MASLQKNTTIPLKQFYINQKFFQDSVLRSLQDDKTQSATGVVIGKREGDKLYVYDVILTPNPERTQSDIKQSVQNGGEIVQLEQKNLLQVLMTKYTEFNYSDWLGEFFNSVERMLTTGIEILGLFTYSLDNNQKNQSFKKLTSIMTRLFTQDADDTRQRKLYDQYVLMSVYQQKVGQSIGDINIYSNQTLSQMSEQLRNATILERLCHVTMNYPLDLTFPFSTQDTKIHTFKDLNDTIQEKISKDLNTSLLQCNKQLILVNHQLQAPVQEQISIQSLIDSAKFEDQTSINFGSQGNQGSSNLKSKGGKQNAKSEIINLQDHEIPSLEFSKLSQIMQMPDNQISNNSSLQNIFRIRGNLHLSCYAVVERQTVKDIVQLFIEDVQHQFKNRLDILDEEAQSNMSLVNPFDLNTDNMTRIDPFDLLLPRKVYFQLPEHLQGIKSKLYFNDYLLFYEKNEDALKRLFEATGLVPRDGGVLKSQETLNPDDCEKKLIRIKSPSISNAQQQKQASQNQNSKSQDQQLKQNLKERTPEQQAFDRRADYARKQFQVRLAIFIISGILMLMSYAYVYIYLM
eukprot:403352411